MTRWEDHVADYLRLRRQLGAGLAWDEHLLGQYTAHLAASGDETITVTGAVAWAGFLPAGVTTRPATRASTRLTALRGFAVYMHALDPVHEVPPHGVFARPVQRPTPHIYTNAEITALLEAAGQLDRGVRAQTYPVLFALLAATGLRVGEALGLDRDDVNLETGVLSVSRGKSGTPRLVPVHERTRTALERYAAWRDERDQNPDGGNGPFFTERDGARLRYGNARGAFVQACNAAGIRTETQHPRMHSLRHTFAVNTLLGWYRDGVDVAARMPVLSTYLGHTDPANTYWYLSAVPELLAHAATRLADAHEEA
ncbi:MAG: tyrosine-type recombinase/integrase [Nocardioides sp.]|nr:tyrosine-type recombinase/integrase [Nocardioides sp.]